MKSIIKQLIKIRKEVNIIFLIFFIYLNLLFVGFILSELFCDVDRRFILYPILVGDPKT